MLLSVVIYYGYLYFRGTRGAKVLTGLAIVFLTLTLISQLLNLVVIGWIIRSFSVFLAVALVVIFQPELRRALAELGGHPIFSLTSEKRETVHDLAEAVTQLANKQFGALIAIERDTSIRVYEETGVIIDADFSVELILTLFHPKVRAARWRSDHAQRPDRRGGLHLSRSASAKRSIAASACGIAPGLASPRNRTRSRLSFRRRPARFPFAIGAGSSAILLRRHSGNASAKFCCTAHYEETDPEQLAREIDLPAARDDALVPHQKERSNDTLAV